MSSFQTETQTFEIFLPTFFENEFDSKIKTLNTKCKRHKLPQIVVKKSKTIIKEIPATSVDEANQTVLNTGKVKKYPVIPITIEFEEIRVKGNWRVVASVEVVEDTEFRVVNGAIENASQYQDLDFYHCDHCGVKRFRRKIIILENPKGKRKVVGRTCVKEYLGISPSAVIANLDLYSWLSKMAAMDVCSCDPDEGGGWGLNNTSSYPSVEEYAKVVVAVMRQDKWNYIKKPQFYDEMYDGHVPTSKKVSDTYYDLYLNPNRHERLEEKDVFVPEDEEDALKALDVLKNQFPESRLNEDLNSFEYNLVIMLATGRAVKESILCGALSRPVREIHNPTKKSAIDITKSEFFGDRGDKVELNVIWDRFKWIQVSSYSYYASEKDVLICTGHVEGTNNIVTWFSNNDGGNVVKFVDDQAVDPIINGEVVKVKATIKDHKDNGKFGKATLLNRVRLAK